MATEITTIIKARTKNQLLTITERPLIASGDANTVLVYFAFDPAWDAFTIKYACFHKANTPHIVYKMLISDDGYATVPHEVLDDAGDIFFGVKGYILDHPEVIKTSLNVKYNILVGANPSSSAPPTPDEFEQMMSEVGRISQEVKVYGENEAERSAAENTRKTNEDARKSAENERNANEDDRKAAELIRSGDEGMRNSYEMARDMAEQQRSAAEDIRKSNEETRVSNETDREAAEAIRDGNEQTRVNNEAARVEAEAIRAAEFAQFEGRIDKNDKRITNLEQGLMADAFESDSSVAYTKTVPAAALPFAEVQEVGGMSYAEEGAIKNAAVTALESVGVNILDISAALNSCLTDNGDGTYTITRTTSSDRFSATFPLHVPKNGRIYARVEIVTSYDGFNGAIPLQIFGEDRKTEVGAASLTSNGNAFAVSNGDAHYARLYLNTNAPIGGAVTFRNPMIKLGSEAMPYAPYVKRTYPIPAEAQALDGWGEGISADCHNRIDWEKKQYRQEVRRIRLDGSEEWNKSTASNIFQASAALFPIAGATKTLRPVISNGYGFSDWYNPDASIKPYFRIMPNGDRLWIEATVDQFASVDAWKAYLAEHPVEIVYPLASPIVTDLPNLTDDNFIEVEGGGTITAVNEYGLAAPTEIIYQMKGVTA